MTKSALDALKQMRAKRKASLEKLKATTYKACESIQRQTVYLDPTKLGAGLEDADDEETESGD